MINRQMQLGLEGVLKAPPARDRRHRRNRANWWFDRMREVVDEALDRPPDAPPAQASLPSTETRPGRNL